MCVRLKSIKFKYIYISITILFNALSLLWFNFELHFEKLCSIEVFLK